MPNDVLTVYNDYMFCKNFDAIHSIIKIVLIVNEICYLHSYNDALYLIHVLESNIICVIVSKGMAQKMFQMQGLQ